MSAISGKGMHVLPNTRAELELIAQCMLRSTVYLRNYVILEHFAHADFLKQQGSSDTPPRCKPEVGSTCRLRAPELRFTILKAAAMGTNLRHPAPEGWQVRASG